MKNRGKRNCILTGLLVFALIAGMFVGNGITAAAAGGTTYHFCAYSGGEHDIVPVEGTILYPGDVLVHYINHRYDKVEYLVYVDNVETQGTAIGNNHYEWTVDATYVVTKIEVNQRQEGEQYITDAKIYIEKCTEAAPVAAVKEPAWFLEFKEDYARMLKDISEAESGASVEIDATVWHSFSAKQLEELMQRKDVDLVFTYAYEGELFKVTIPAGTEMTYDCEWYGPLKVASMFGREDLE
ncbi:MAG: hypothetical protein IJ405_05100 [Lachnospiraceae bacterium]|nr:hypothetical protein [Lachnospiraceae bacterium]